MTTQEYTRELLDFWAARDEQVHLDFCPSCGLESLTVFCQHCGYDIALHEDKEARREVINLVQTWTRKEKP